MTRINSCAICRKKLLKPLICNLIKSKKEEPSQIILTIDYVYLDRNEQRRLINNDEGPYYTPSNEEPAFLLM